MAFTYGVAWMAQFYTPEVEVFRSKSVRHGVENFVWAEFWFSVVLVIVVDFGAFLSHYITYKTRLWHFHKVHHSA